jgi:ABC-type uncharacterized transport system substrate-binding protein
MLGVQRYMPLTFVRGIYMIKLLLLTLIWLIAPANLVYAHPHAFVECTFAFVMDREGLVGFKQHWTLDEMTSAAVLDVVDSNRDGALSAQENDAVRKLSVESLLAYHYFTVAKINGNDFPVKKISDFSAELKNGKLRYEFMVPCRVKAPGGQRQEIKVAIYDGSFYTYVAYAEKGGMGMDPTKDALFANRQAPAKPEDFKRFSKAMGLDKFKGRVRVQGGDTALFSITSTMRDEPDMAYFYGQIVPQAFVLVFETK